MKLTVLLLVIAATGTSLVAAVELDCNVSLSKGFFDFRESVFDLCSYDKDMHVCYDTKYPSGTYCFVFNPFRPASTQDDCNIYETKHSVCYADKDATPYYYGTGFEGFDDYPQLDIGYSSSDLEEYNPRSHIEFVCDESASPGIESKVKVDYFSSSSYVRLQVHVKESCPGQESQGQVSAIGKIYISMALICILPPLFICLVACVIVVVGAVGCLGGGAMCCGGLGAGVSKYNSHKARAKAEQALHNHNMQEPLLESAQGRPVMIGQRSAVVSPLPTSPSAPMAPAPGAQMRGANGLQVFKGADGTVFVLIDGVLRAVPKGIFDGSAFLHTFGIPNDAAFMNGQVEGLAVGMPLPEFFQAVQIAGAHGVYLLIDEPSAPGVMTKRLIAGPNEFSAYRLALEKVATMDAGQMDTIPDGPVIQF